MGSFWAELKRRNVFKVGVAYLVIAWLLIQVTDIVAPALHLPDWTLTFIVFLLVIGFPLALFLSWVFELTPEGIKVTSSDGPDKFHTRTTGQQLNYTIMGVLALAVVLMAIDNYVLTEDPGSPSTEEGSTSAAGKAPAPPAADAVGTATAAPDRSIAVLPFVDMSPEGDQEYFSDGLSEELLNALAQLPGVRVIARTSSFAFKGTSADVRTIGQTLGVSNLLEGSVRKSRERLRITAQLIEVTDGSHRWSQTYDRELDDVFTIQEEIAQAVTDALSVTLGVGESTRLPGGTTNVAAYELVLRARDWILTAPEDEIGPTAAALYHQALALDPGYAQAWTGLSSVLGTWGLYEPARAEELGREREMVVERALALAPDLAEAHAQSAIVLANRGDWRGAVAAMIRVRELAPPELRACDPAAMAVLGYREEPVACSRIASELDPLSLLASDGLQRALLRAGRYAEAEAEYRRTLTFPGDRERVEHMALLWFWEEHPNAEIKDRMRRYLDYNSVTMPVFHQVFDVYDDPEAALALLQAAVDDPAYQDGVRPALLALWLGHYGDPERALLALQRWIQLRGLTNNDLLWFPSLTGARRLPGFQDLVREIGMADYWRASGDWGDFCHPVGEENFGCE